MKPTKQRVTDHPGNSHGFTLIETLIAILIFSVGIMAVMSLTVSSMNSFTRSRNNCVEVHRTTLNLEALKEAGYDNGNIFTGAQVAPAGTDGQTVSYNDINDTVVIETKLISIQNNIVRGVGPNGNYELYYTKPFIE